MTAAIGYDNITYFHSFIGTLRRVYDGDIRIFISEDTTPEIRSYLSEQGVILKELTNTEIQDEISFYLQTSTMTTTTTFGTEEEQQQQVSEAYWEAFNRYRFRFFQEACEHPTASYAYCLASDFRDTIFQANPFTTVPLNHHDDDDENIDLHLFEHSLKMNQWHFRRAAACGLYKEFANKLRYKPILNAGGILGTPEAFRALQNIMMQLEGCNDQVVLNAAYYGNLFDDNSLTIKSYSQGYGHVNNVAYGAVVKYGPGGEFLDRDGFISPVVHQYDFFSERSLWDPTQKVLMMGKFTIELYQVVRVCLLIFYFVILPMFLWIMYPYFQRWALVSPIFFLKRNWNCGGVSGPQQKLQQKLQQSRIIATTSSTLCANSSMATKSTTVVSLGPLRPLNRKGITKTA